LTGGKSALVYAISLLSDDERADLLLAIIRAEVLASFAKVESATDSGLHDHDDVEAVEPSDHPPVSLEAKVFANAIAALPRERRASLMATFVQGLELAPIVALGSCDGRPPASEINEARKELEILLREKWTRAKRGRGSGR